MTQLRPGDQAPAFDLDSDAGIRVSLASLAGRTAVIFFYPKDSTPGCTLESIGFSRAEEQFRAAGVAVFGVSRDSVASHCRFRDRYALKVPLLSDPDLAMHREFGVWGTKMMYGREVEGTIRSTFVIGPDGRVVLAEYGVKVTGHVNRVLAAVVSGAAPITEPTPDDMAASGRDEKKPAAKKTTAAKKAPAAEKKPVAKKAPAVKKTATVAKKKAAK